MASLNLSINGPSIKSSYQGVINAPAPPAGSSSTYAQWVLLSVQAPLANAFQDGGSKESVLKVQSTGDGELDDLIEDFNEGRIQFAFVKVKDPNTGLPKYALIAWCGEGVPERTRGYFINHLNAVSKVLHGYHVQITARTEAHLEPTNILKKVADASGANYTAGGSAPVKPKGPAPAVKSKPVFAASSGATISFNPIIAARNASLRQKGGDDGWGEDAPPVSRSEIQKVQSAYKPTKVNMDELRSQKQAPTRFNGSAAADDRPSDVIGGSYKPVGKVDIAAIRAAAKEKKDDRPAPVKGAYEPVGKVDIAAIRSRAQKPAEAEADDDYQPKSLAERTAAFSRPARLTELPKPKVAKKFSGASSFMGTKAPLPGALGFGGPSPAAAAPVGTASRTFADQGGKTPAQIWAEKKAQQGGVVPVAASPPITPQITAQQSGSGWQSGYSGKSWKPVETAAYGRGIPGQKPEDTVSSNDVTETPSVGVSAIRDQFNEAPPPVPSVARPRDITVHDEQASPPPVASSGFALPGMPPRPTPAPEEEEPEPERSPSPVRIAVPVPRGPEPEIEPVEEPRQSLPVRSLEQEVPSEREIPYENESHDPRAAAIAVAEEQFRDEPSTQAPAGISGGHRALVQYDYEKAEDNELELREGEYVTNIDMVDEDWWMGTNAQGETGLFPSNYVELVEGEAAEEAHAAAPPSPPAPAAAVSARPAPVAEPAHVAEDVGFTATAQFDYEAAEDNELSFPENATITHLEFPDEDWWYGHYNGQMGLFPANYVQRDQ
ncbi:putative amylase-binding protein [Rosellinia necatrix]|uniref:Putative amylase-binding protein n=1 Tax=Rosellinia necatrix TaxID=77044 RepID=A0A1W2TBE8_ROSNE|nr:putative amylase-binding protein [Rosellinia necatrix]